MSNKWSKLLDVIFKPVEFNVLPDRVLSHTHLSLCEYLCTYEYTTVIGMAKLMTASLKIKQKRKKKMAQEENDKMLVFNISYTVCGDKS